MSEESPSQGKYFEDFRKGQVMNHQLGRTVTDVDNIWFTLLTCNTNPVHFNEDYAKKNFPGQPFNGRLLVNGALTFAIVTGLSVEDTSKHGLMLGLSNMKMLHPVFAGDTLYSRSEVIEARESKSRKGMGLVTIRTVGYKSDSTSVIEFERTFLVRKRGEIWK